MNRDPREIRKDKVLNDMRQELQEIARIKRSPAGKRAFMIEWMNNNFGNKIGAVKNEQIQKN